MGILAQAQADLAGIFTTDGFGQSVTYTPANGEIAAFSVVAIPGQVNVDRVLERHVVSDFCEMRIRHVDLVAGGVTSPTTRIERRAGDQITKSNLAGTSETWEVIDKDYSPTGYWILICERNIRIVP